MPALIFVIVWIVSIAGWVANIFQIVAMVFNDVPITSLFIAKLVGIPVVPLGSVLGLCGIF